MLISLAVLCYRSHAMFKLGRSITKYLKKKESSILRSGVLVIQVFQSPCTSRSEDNWS